MSQYGIGFSWVIGDSAQAIQVTRSGDSSGSPSTGTEELIATMEPGTTQYIDLLPNDNTLRHYRVRHIAPNYDPGTFSGYVRAKPQRIPQFEQPQNFKDTF